MNIDTVLSSRLKSFLDHHRTRTRLRERLNGLPARELDRLAWDVGLSRAELLREAYRPFWKTVR